MMVRMDGLFYRLRGRRGLGLSRGASMCLLFRRRQARSQATAWSVHFTRQRLKKRSDLAHQIERALAPAGPSYSPIYRHPSASATSQTHAWDVARDDLAMAFERYLYTKNQMRGILLVSAPDTEALVAPILQRIESDPRLLERFSGVVWLQEASTAPDIDVRCSPAMQGDCEIVAEIRRKSSWTRWILPQMPRKPVRFDISAKEGLGTKLAQRNTKLSIWLDEFAPKPAEPLGGIEDMEIVEVAPIRRPGETDEALASQDEAIQTD